MSIDRYQYRAMDNIEEPYEDLPAGFVADGPWRLAFTVPRFIWERALLSHDTARKMLEAAGVDGPRLYPEAKRNLSHNSVVEIPNYGTFRILFDPPITDEEYKNRGVVMPKDFKGYRTIQEAIEDHKKGIITDAILEALKEAFAKPDPKPEPISKPESNTMLPLPPSKVSPNVQDAIVAIEAHKKMIANLAPKPEPKKRGRPKKVKP